MLVVTMLPTANVQAASKVKLSKNKITIYVGKSETLKDTGTSKKVTWTSSDKKKATVSSKGKVTAKKAGSVTITAKVGNKKYTCKVTVEGHTAGNWEVTVQPTENCTGTKVKNCTVCGIQLESTSIDKIAHSHSYSWETNGSSRTMKCSCGATGITEECVA